MIDATLPAVVPTDDHPHADDDAAFSAGAMHRRTTDATPLTRVEAIPLPPSTEATNGNQEVASAPELYADDAVHLPPVHRQRMIGRIRETRIGTILPDPDLGVRLP